MLLHLLCALDGIDQDTLAARARVSASTLWRYGTGEIRARASTLDRLTRAVGLPWPYVQESILPALRQWRLAAAGEPTAGAHADTPSILDLAEQLGERVRARVAAEMGGPAWDRREPNPEDPRPEDRSEAELLASCLEGADPPEVDLLLAESPELHSWVLVEHLCHRSTEDGPGAGRLLDLARLASRIARLMPGAEPWQARVQAYAEAHLGRALAEAGDPNAAALAWATAGVLWDRGADPQELLSEARFRQALGAREAAQA